MLTAISGIYANGQITLEHLPKINKEAKVIVIFEEEFEKKTVSKKRTFGVSKGMIEMSSDFNEPLDDLKDYM